MRGAYLAHAGPLRDGYHCRRGRGEKILTYLGDVESCHREVDMENTVLMVDPRGSAMRKVSVCVMFSLLFLLFVGAIGCGDNQRVIENEYISFTLGQ